LAYELSENPAAEILPIVLFELEWFLKMQCEKTGGVHHKVSCAQFNALDEMPHDEMGELFLLPISPAATADFAATMALASRFYPEHREKFLHAAERAWNWLEANPDAPNFTNPPDIRTGQYGDEKIQDELFWAACELFAATGNEKYHDFIKSSEICTGLGWAEMGTYGIVAYLKHCEKRDAALTENMRKKLFDECERIIGKNKNEPYGTSQETKYRWGSNFDVANNAMTLLLYSLVAEKNSLYEEIATEHMHYLLGRNPLSISYITGFGANAAKNPHHRPSVAVGSAFAGMVVGGPNNTTVRDTALQSHCEGNPPSKFYVDHKDSFASNEIAIYWNGAVYFVAAVLNCDC
jgi:endoglucanase